MKEYEINEAKKEVASSSAVQELALIGFQTKMKELSSEDLTSKSLLEQVNKYSSALEWISSWVAFYAEKLSDLEGEANE